MKNVQRTSTASDGGISELEVTISGKKILHVFQIGLVN